MSFLSLHGSVSAARKELKAEHTKLGLSNVTSSPVGCLKARRKFTLVRLLLQPVKPATAQAEFVGEHEVF